MTKKTDYKTLQTELDAILDTIQGSTLDIDEAMKAYERGMKLIAELELYLDKAQHTVTKLQQKFGDK